MPLHVITGASGGLGAATASQLLRRGEDVIGVSRSEVAEVSGPGRYRHVAGDVLDAGVQSEVVDAVAGRTVAGLVHAAASPIGFAPWPDIHPDYLTSQFAVHVAAPISLTGALLQAGPVERTLIFDSYSAIDARPHWAAYSIVKAAAQMAFRAAAQELVDTAVVRVFPGAVATPLLARVLNAPPEVAAAAFYRSLQLDGKVSEPADIATGVADLLGMDPATLRGQETWHLGHSASME